MKGKIINWFIIGTFAILYIVTSLISTIHVIDFFELSNPRWMSISLAIAFELGAAASLASIIVLDKMNKTLIWSLFIVITGMQVQGNLYFAFTNLSDFSTWSELFNIIDEEIIYQKRVISIVSGAILPLVALGFIKSLVDYIKPDQDIEDEKYTIDESEVLFDSQPENWQSDKTKENTQFRETETISNDINKENIIIDAKGSAPEENYKVVKKIDNSGINNTSAYNKDSERKYPLNL
jgi:hypothetical protein